jgi:hypothetical protein
MNDNHEIRFKLLDMKRILNWLFGPIPDSVTDNPNHVFRNVVIWLSFLTILIFITMLSLKCNRLVGALTFLTVAGASLAGGAAIGFLFGFPRAEKYRFNKSNNTDHNSNQNSYSDNTNLEEVSDWLTKIIVGLTLIKLNTIIGWINQSANSIASVYSCDFSSEHYNFYVFGYCVIIIYFLSGAGLFYVWARTNLSIIFTRSREKQLQAENTKLLREVQALANDQLPNTERNVLNVDEQIPSDTFRSTIERIYNSKLTYKKDDLQKARWGGVALRNDRILEAIYDDSKSLPGLASVKLRVRSTNTENPLNGEVAFFLHDTFKSQIEFSKASNGIAEISKLVWEAFVAGARLEDGTELELDLNTVQGFPADFYWK